MPAALRLCSLYPELMNIYADRGNIAVLRARCEWRGIGFELAASSLREPLDPDAHDLFYMGGGQDRDQAAVAQDMVETKREALHAAAARGAVILAVCGGYQLLGSSYALGGEELPGIGLVDLRTVREKAPRLIGNCAIEADLDGERRVIAGFENHGGRTYLGPGERPLGRVLRGHGNNGKDRTEGVRRGNVIGTYLHGPLLPKNVWLADRLIELALGIELRPLDDELEEAAHASARRAAGLTPPPPQRPVEPKPPAPRAVSSSDATSRSSGDSTLTTRSCAIRSPGATSNAASRSVFSSSTRTSPRYPASISPGALTTEIPCRVASPERGSTSPACPSGMATATPVPMLARSPGQSRALSAAYRS
jgi:CobQ-like glutamine amidotransferase family enzyme